MSAAAIIAPLECPTCKGPVDVKSRHVAVAGAAIRVYCSADCQSGLFVSAAQATPAAVAEAPRRVGWWILGAIAIGASAGAATWALRRPAPGDLDVPAPQASSVFELPLPTAPSAPAIAAVAEREHDKALVDELARDAWIHPLAGPVRRMPVNHNGAFGAERAGAGERPPECVSGHCGVDLGHVWGEPVHAVHEGVVDLVQRASNDEHGGLFVRIAHRDGTLFSWYFHLAAIPRSIVPGTKVTAGRVVGLLGDTGVKHSEPHLHFALSVKTSKQAQRYLDPEPLVAIWPLWITDGETGHVSTTHEPGLPVRAPSGRKKPAHVEAAQPPAVEPPVTAVESTAAVAAP